MTPYKKSCGVLALDKSNRIILILKKYTYEFMCLILGFHRSVKLQNITEVEREMILRYDIYKIYSLYFKKNDRRYKSNKNKIKKRFNLYKSSIEKKHNCTFRKHIQSLKLRENVKWEIPKGGSKKSETNLECAKREFIEETGMVNIEIIDQLPIIEKKIIRNKVYENYYYFGTCDGVQVYTPDKREISIVSTFSIYELKHINMDKSKKKIVYSFLKNYY